MFFGILSLLWTAGYSAAVYWVAQKLGSFDIQHLNQLTWIVPIWALGEVYMFHLFKKRKSEKIVQQAAADHPFVPVKGFVPMAMPSQGKSMMYMPKPAVSAPVPESQPQSVPQPAVQQSSAPNPATALEKQAVETITKLAEEKGLTAFPHVLLQNILIPLTISADIKALLLTFLSQSGTWKVEPKDPVEETLWINQTTTTPLLKKLLEAKKTLSEMESEAEVVPVIILLDGDVENESQVQEFLQQTGIRLVRLNPKENSTLLTVSELMDKEFEGINLGEEESTQGAENV